MMPNVSLALAEKLLEIDAVQINLAQPFIWSSGLQSPIYCDNRQTLAYSVRSTIKQDFIDLIKSKFSTAEVIAGVATGGIPYATLVADALSKPLVYVRPKPKAHGLKRQVEGRLAAGQKVIVIEDLIATGQSALRVIQSLQAAQAEVLGLCAIVDYGFEQARWRFEEAKIPTYSLTKASYIFKSALGTNRITAAQYHELLAWHSKVVF